MNIGEIIRGNRKKMNMTQEELTEEEVKAFLEEAEKRLGREAYDDVFVWAKELLELYPNCEQLILQMAVVLDAQRMLNAMPDDEKYDSYIYNCYRRCLQSKDEDTRQRAADVLFGFYVRREQYDKAEAVLAYIPEQDPERKRKQAQLYSQTGRVQEAYKAYEELLFSGYQTMSAVFHGIYMLALQDKDMKKAHALVDKQQKLAELFEMGKYHEMSCKLELATIEKDADTTIDTMKQMIAGLSDIMHFTTAPLYEHMTFKEAREEFIMNLRDNLMACFCDEETYGFLKDDKRYQELLKEYME